MTLESRLKASGAKAPVSTKKNTPVWKGPDDSGNDGGITFSLLSRFLCCRERFRLMVIDGLKPAKTFQHRVEYGNMWHLCEERLAAVVKTRDYHKAGSDVHWVEATLKEYCKALCKKYPAQQEQVDHWYNVCRVQFPVYIKYWAKHPDVAERKPIFQEQKFHIPYLLPSGRTVWLRGKWDGVDVVGRKKPVVTLQENKTKGEIDERQVVRQLTFDLQTMLYLVAIQVFQDGTGWGNDERQQLSDTLSGPGRNWVGNTKAVRYNVVRRPLSGGKGDIRRHKPTKNNPSGESKESFYSRLKDIIEGDPDSFFMRWNITVTEQDIMRFRRETLDPVLEQLCDWWEWVNSTPPPHFTDATRFSGPHWRHPFGVYNVMDEGGVADLDEYLASGSEIGLERVDTLFPEL